MVNGRWRHIYDHTRGASHLIMTVLTAAGLAACASREPLVRTEYVVTPTYCSVRFPDKPQVNTNFTGKTREDYILFIDNLQKFLVYTDELEMALLCCTNSHDCITKGNGATPAAPAVAR